VYDIVLAPLLLLPKRPKICDELQIFHRPRRSICSSRRLEENLQVLGVGPRKTLEWDVLKHTKNMMIQAETKGKKQGKSLSTEFL
jgi:hypothetical protein